MLDLVIKLQRTPTKKAGAFVSLRHGGFNINCTYTSLGS